MAITAVRLGATLPIKMSERGKPPLPKEKQVVKKERFDCFQKEIVYLDRICIEYQHHQLPRIKPFTKAESEEEEASPIVFESVSGIQSDACIGVYAGGT